MVTLNSGETIISPEPYELQFSMNLCRPNFTFVYFSSPHNIPYMIVKNYLLTNTIYVNGSRLEGMISFKDKTSLTNDLASWSPKSDECKAISALRDLTDSFSVTEWNFGLSSGFVIFEGINGNITVSKVPDNDSFSAFADYSGNALAKFAKDYNIKVQRKLGSFIRICGMKIDDVRTLLTENIKPIKIPV